MITRQEAIERINKRQNEANVFTNISEEDIAKEMEEANMKMGLNRNEVMEQVAKMISDGESFKARYGWSKKWRIADVYEKLSIFDWWNDYLSVSQLKQMKNFLEIAGKMGYNGYVCFKVGAKYCSNGMWAHKDESTTGYSPDGEFLYHSFVSGRNDYDCMLADGTLASSKVGRDCLTLNELKKIINVA